MCSRAARVGDKFGLVEVLVLMIVGHNVLHCYRFILSYKVYNKRTLLIGAERIAVQ